MHDNTTILIFFHVAHLTIPYAAERSIMKLKKYLTKLTALLSVGSMLISTGSIGTNAAAKDTMVFRTSFGGDKVAYLFESDLKNKDVVLKGNVYIDNYPGIAHMKLSLHSYGLKIENGGFTVPELFDGFDASNTKDESEYYRNVAIANVTDTCMFYNKSFPYKNAVLAKDGTSFLSYDVRVPKGLTRGCYDICVMDGWSLNAAGQREYQTFAYNEDGEELEFVQDSAYLVVEPTPILGDVDLDGDIDSDDANLVLYYYLLSVMGESEESCDAQLLNETYIHSAKLGADPNKDKHITADDASAILCYYTETLVGNSPNWSMFY